MVLGRRSHFRLAFYFARCYDRFSMDTVLTYRRRAVSRDEVKFIQELIEGSPGASRRALSQEICRSWNWVQVNGTPCDAVCRALLLELDRGGHIVLPPPQWRPKHPPRRRLSPTRIEIPAVPLAAGLREIGLIQIKQVRRTPDEGLVNSLIEQHHYLGYVHPVGEHLKYLVTAREQPIACFTWSSAPRHLGPRDRYLGWSPSARTANIRLVAYQSRFLILPWVRVPHLASHLLGRMARQLSADWERVYSHPIYFTETFVDPARYRGTCYRAANWTYLGMTTGRGKNAPTKKPTRSLKQVFGYALVKDFRKRLGEIR
jgi:hypothetical protein